MTEGGGGGQCCQTLKKQKLPTKITEDIKYARDANMLRSLLKKSTLKEYLTNPAKCPAETWHETARKSSNAILQLHLWTQKRIQLRETQAEYHIATNSVTVTTVNATSLIREGINTVSVLNWRTLSITSEKQTLQSGKRTKFRRRKAHHHVTTVHLLQIPLTRQLSTSTAMMEVMKIKWKRGQINGLEAWNTKYSIFSVFVFNPAMNGWDTSSAINCTE